MGLFERRPALSRLLVGLLTSLLVVLAAVTFVNYASSPTDENVFALTPAKMTLYVSTEMPSPEGPIQPGDLIDQVEKQPVYTTEQLVRAFGRAPADSALSVRVYRPAQRSFAEFHLRRGDIPEGGVVFLEDFIAVTEVTPGGASDRAGMKVGDLILRINGEGFKDAQGADLILRRGQTGKSITYEVLRRNEPITLQVTLARFGFPLALLIFSLSGMCMMGIGAFIVLKRPQIPAARSVGLSLLLLGYFFTVLLIRRDAYPNWLISVRDATVLIAFLSGVVLTTWSTVLFPKERIDLAQKRWILWVSAGVALLGMIANRYVDDRSALVTIAVILAFHFVVRFIHRKKGTPEHRRLSRVIRWTAIATVVVVVASGFLAIFLGRSNVGVAGVALLAIPLSYLYTIGRYRLLDMNLRVRRNVQYSLVSIVWGVLLAGVLIAVFMSLPDVDFRLPAIVIRGASIEVLDDAQAGLAREWTNRMVLMVCGVICWYLLWRLRGGGQTWIDRKYDRTQYDYRRAVNELGEVLAKKLSMADLGKGLAEKIAELMHVRRAGVFFFREGSVSGCHEAFGIDQDEWLDFCTPVEKELREVLMVGREQVQEEYLPPSLKGVFRAHAFQVLVPIRSKGRLLGAMTLGEKMSEATYSDDDYAFLAAAAAQASVAMENAFLYEELAEKERLKLELQIARRIQLASLPQHTPALKGLDIAGVSVPALEVGGDFFDYLNGVAGRMTIVVGDVSGKGTSAALYMSKVQGIFRSLHGFGLSPGDLFIRANGLLCGDMEKKSFVTAVGAAFDTQKRTILLARAGHLPLYHYRMSEGRVVKITPRGLGLGLNNEGVFSSELEETVVHYAAGDILVFVTDGITEAQNGAGELFGEDRLMSAIVARAGTTAAEIRDGVLKDADGFSAGVAQHDDETIVVVRGT